MKDVLNHKINVCENWAELKSLYGNLFCHELGVTHNAVSHLHFPSEYSR